MFSRPESDEALIKRLLPSTNQDRADRAQAWAEWHSLGETLLAGFIRVHNNTAESDDDLLQETLLTAYLGVERGQYQPREGVPFTAYVKGIARNKIREARRRSRPQLSLDEIYLKRDGELPRQPEEALERHEQQAQVQVGLQQLSGARRQVMLRFLNGESTEAIAQQMALSEALVRQHKCRGLRALKQQCNYERGGPAYSTAA
jgi:RNA polymerase sigma factor (sigma-70 family)